MAIRNGTYQLVEITPYHYEFYSEGPKGSIKKLIIYQSLNNSSNLQLFNLAFGDWNEIDGILDDNVISNNNDREKLLNTVAQSVVNFTNNFPEVMVFAKGSSASRTRLYQIGISKFFPVISLSFEVKGYFNNKWELFNYGKNYEAFSIRLLKNI